MIPVIHAKDCELPDILRFGILSHLHMLNWKAT
jgi:hypothetical protein